ncbi:hypothetical protein HNV10_01370 [Winogradskyella litoriviva]|uniref:Uncharacterized protein n=1 Tax=Winogradskyella litoriviva TaxID=1220182 RepID=A0ABX2E037_9FLAO|nr:hypothetical protein [Winogradskyella litoriviva]NRD21871.1 hypothetical protein [Winogradskyella litoriviva]
MKTLKFTLAIVAVLLLTISGVQPETVVNNSDESTIQSKSNFDLLATSKKKLDKPTNS